CSNGQPYPLQLIHAFEVVINFAVTRLGFPLSQIYLYGWSIGGFPVAWAASHYPELRGVILDATFDDVLPLARSRIPIPLLCKCCFDCDFGQLFKVVALEKFPYR